MAHLRNLSFPRAVPVFIVLCLANISAQAKYSGGSGEPNNPYQIAAAADLIALSREPNDYDKHFVLTADIDLDPNLPGNRVFDTAVIAPDIDAATRSFQGTAFTGVLDGQGHVIRKLTIDSNIPVAGLLGMIGIDGVVRNLHLIGGSVRGQARDLGRNVGIDGYTGALAGINQGVVTGCSSTGLALTGGYVGGLVGYNQRGSISACHSTSSINDAWAVSGALVGYNYYGMILACHSAGSVNSRSSVGGLVGNNYHGTISACYSTASVYASGAGGLVGSNNGTISACYSAGSVVADVLAGGLVSYNHVGGAISSCYSTGPVAAINGVVGGLAALNDMSTITHCYSTGSITCTFGDSGGLVADGIFAEDVVASFWDTETSGRTVSRGGTGLTTAQMQTAGTFTDAGWDFVGETANGKEDIWKIAEGAAYPRLAWEKYGGGSGEPNDPYQIATAADLIALGKDPNDYDKHFILIADIDLSGIAFDVIAPNLVAPYPGGGRQPPDAFPCVSFTGVFDGKGHTIRHLTVADGRGGLFGGLGTSAVVKNLGIVDVNTSGTVYGLGGLAGWNSGTVSRCYCTGVVAGGYGVGGLVGFNVSGTIAQCYSTCTVVGDLQTGGLVGSSTGGTVTQCYSTGLVVMGDSSANGLIGANTGGTVSGCFWDTETSHQSGSSGGTGKTAAQMQTAQTFLDAGWDFVGETTNGTADLWRIDEGKDYPRLSWQPAEKSDF